MDTDNLAQRVRQFRQSELDSLADVVSFGVAPAVLVVSLQGGEFPALGWGLATFI